MFRIFSPKDTKPLTLEKQLFNLLEKKKIDIKNIQLGYLQNNTLFIDYFCEYNIFRIELTSMLFDNLEDIVCFFYKKVLKDYCYIGKFRNMETCFDYISILLERGIERNDEMTDIPI